MAVLIYSLKHVGLFQAALTTRGIPSVVSGGSSVLLTQAGADWLSLLEALEQPHRSARVRSVALTPFVGLTAEALDAGGEDLTDDVAERVRRWLDLLRSRGIAAVHEAVVADGLAARVLARPGGERLLTDLTHLGQVLHEVAHRERLGLPGLLEWLRDERRAAATSNERTRRLDTDARAVQFVTIHASKGLQYPVVHLPLLFDKWSPDEVTPLFHDDDGRRTLDVGGQGEGTASSLAARAEQAGEELRLTYVALTRAQSQVVTWWAPTWNAGNSGLTRLLLGREPGGSGVPDTVPRGPSDLEVVAALTEWQTRGALSLEVSELRPASARCRARPPTALGVRRFDRGVDTEWRRTSYSGLIRAEEQSSTGGVDSEPEVEGTVDEAAAEEAVEAEAPGDADRHRPSSPVATCPRRWTGCPPARRSAPWSTASSSTPTRRPPTSPPSWPAGSRSSAAGGPSTPPPRRSPRRCCRCRRPRSARWREDAPWPRSGSATGCASSTSSSRWPVASARPPATYPSPRQPPSCGVTWPPTTRCAPTPTGWSRRRWATSRCAATSPAPSTWCCASAPGPTSASSSSTTRPTGSARWTCRSPRSTTPRS